MKRDNAFDLSKGLGILVIAFFHIFNYPEWSTIIIEAIAVWRMSYFFVISGYFYKNGRKPGENIRRRTKQLLKPYFQYSIGLWLLATVYNLITGAFTFGQNFFQYLQFLVSRQSLDLLGVTLNTGIPTERGAVVPGLQFPSIVIPFWFVMMMFFAYIIFYLIAEWALSKPGRFASCTGFMILATFVMNQYLPALPWNFQNAPMSVALLLIGAALGKHKALEAEKTTGKWAIVNAAAALGIILLLVSVWPGIGSFAGGSIGKNGAVEVFPSVLWGLLGAYLSITACRYIAKLEKVSKVLCWVGERSMPILLVHIPISTFLQQALGFAGRRTGLVAPTFLTYLATIAIIIVYRLVWEYILKKVVRKHAA